MPNNLASKVLSKGQIKNLLNDNKNVNRSIVEPQRWPGDANMLKIAAAVERRAKFVLFTNGKRFSIRYNDHLENVLLRPSTGGFAPMGYFSYKHLQEAVTADAVKRESEKSVQTTRTEPVTSEGNNEAA